MFIIINLRKQQPFKYIIRHEVSKELQVRTSPSRPIINLNDDDDDWLQHPGNIVLGVVLLARLI